MGYCGNPQCNDPWCAGSPSSGLYPALLKVGNKDISIEAWQYRALARKEPVKGFGKRELEAIKQRQEEYFPPARG